jgi:hypothetical protein
VSATLRRSGTCVIVFAVLVALPSAVAAQYGHPMKGQWSGQWGKENQRLLLDLDWDGKTIVGTINPGPNAIRVTAAAVNYTDPGAGKWNVKLTGEGKDESGKPVKVDVDGTLENIGSNYRVFHGTWIQNGARGEFVVTRN